MEFKKKQPKPYENPMDGCRRRFKSGITFNNGNLLQRKQSAVTILNIVEFHDNKCDDITMVFTADRPTNECIYTVYKDGKYADIIP